ncbi:CHAT domain-containing protein [uncultured Microscilla sp.]|uniref:CHAT domain-containing protein n=1 Tax=uncultured Microscilla sp. TaxID=432653 RepID=UPI00260D660B|nr:CHAT domain-containing protein [uncultured Microscilla sp.]
MHSFPPSFIEALKTQVQAEYSIIVRYRALKNNANDPDMRQSHQAEIDLRQQNIAEIQADFLQQAQYMGGADVPNAQLADLIKKEVEKITGQSSDATKGANSPLPVVFTVFANPKQDLEYLTEEQNAIQSMLMPLDEKQCKHIVRSDTHLADYFEFLKRWKNRIAIFHYGGHANSVGLKLVDHDSFFTPLAKELAKRNKDALQLVFLNGCSTHYHVKTLFEAGVKSVIATRVAVGDKLASDFAVQFYNNIASGDNLREAFESTCHYIEAVQGGQGKRYRIEATPMLWRGSVKRNSEEDEKLPWRLYTLDEAYLEYALPPEAPLVSNTKAQQSKVEENKNVYNHGGVKNQINHSNIQGDVNF